MEKINKAAIALTITNVFHYALLCKKKMREHSGKMAKQEASRICLPTQIAISLAESTLEFWGLLKASLLGEDLDGKLHY